jgi:hypothetical protein
LVCDIQIIDLGLEPECIGQSFFVALQQRDNRAGNVLQLFDIHFVFAVEALLEIFQELFDLFLVRALKHA